MRGAIWRVRQLVRGCSWPSLAAALSLTSPSARADDVPADAGAAPLSAAEQLAAEAFKLYKEGNYTKAVTLYERAYRQEPVPSILFNIGRIYQQKLREPARARDYYQRFLA